MKLYNGDCLEVLKTLEDKSVDSIVSDPPYGISFMGKKWDYDVPSVEVWKECLRVLKPGGHALIACGTRTQHRMAVNLEDAGFEIRDIVAWVYGCLSEDTEILTINGWERYHKNIDKNPVLCYNINNKKFEFYKPQRKFLYENKHTAYRIQSDNTDQIVSRNHRVLVKRGGELIFKKAETLERQENIPFLESLRELPETIYDFQSHSSIKKSVLLKKVRREENKKKGVAIKSKKINIINLSYLWRKILYTYLSFKKSKKSLLFEKLCWESKRLVERCCLFGFKKLEFRKQTKIKRTNDWGEKSIVERWNNIFQKARQLFTNKICEMSERIFSYGSQRWLCYGTSAIYGTGIGQTTFKDRGSSSYKPQSTRQQNRKFNALQNEQRTQDIRVTRAKITEIKYKGKVWCVEVPTGAFVARRKGKIFITGNSGFPKSLNIGKALDKKPEVLWTKKFKKWLGDKIDKCGKTQKQINDECGFTATSYKKIDGKDYWSSNFPTKEKWQIMKKVIGLSDEYDFVIRDNISERGYIKPTGNLHKGSGNNIQFSGKQLSNKQIEHKHYEGWGTALKPAMELWTLCRKPLEEKTVAENVLKWGTGGINIDECRVEGKLEGDPNRFAKTDGGSFVVKFTYSKPVVRNKGRFPANFIYDGSDEVARLFPDNVSRFFYCAKASKSERNAGLEGFEEKEYTMNSTPKRQFIDGVQQSVDFTTKPLSNKNNHPTIKPIKLMQYLCRFITPKGGIVLDIYMGSGSTGIACKKEGFDFIGIEKEEEYFKIAEARIKNTPKPMI